MGIQAGTRAMSDQETENREWQMVLRDLSRNAIRKNCLTNCNKWRR